MVRPPVFTAPAPAGAIWSAGFSPPPLGQSPTFRDHPATYISSLDHTFRDDPPVSIAIKFLAAYRAIAEERLQGAGGVLPALPSPAVEVAELPCLRGVYAVKPDTLAVNIQRVAIDHAGLAGDVGPSWQRQENDECQDDQEAEHSLICFSAHRKTVLRP